jgi:hypothetical protein
MTDRAESQYGWAQRLGDRTALWLFAWLLTGAFALVSRLRGSNRVHPEGR